MSEPARDESHETPANLKQWLETATRRLSADSCRRVRREIAEHFSTALTADAYESLFEELLGEKS